MKKANDYSLLASIATASLVVLVLFAWQGSKGFHLWDEGFLWYGAQRVLLGEVPIRDFMAYDPGRYYWSAALMGLTGNDGVIGLRVAAAVFQALGITAGLWLISGSSRSGNKGYLPYLLVSAVTLAAWMFPYYRLFDASLSILLVGALSLLVEHPTSKRYFIAGCCVGLVAVFGRNHGVYGVVGSLGTMLWLNIRRVEGPGFIKGFALWAIGVSAGFAPVLLMALFVPGFATAFWESIRFLFEYRATNLPLPVPWPWTVNLATASAGDAARGVLTGIFFVAILAFAVLAIFWSLLQKARGRPVAAPLVAAAFLSFPYAHYAFSRADAEHLALSMFPLLVGCLVLLSAQAAKVKWPLAVALCFFSVWVTYVHHPGWQCERGKPCVGVEISGSSLQVDPRPAADIALLRELASQFAQNGRSFLAVPYWPGAYPLLGRRSPIWEIYALIPRSEAFEKREIERIKASDPGFVVVLDLPLDGRDELRFRNTHPLIHQYIRDNFERVQNFPHPAYQIYVARSSAGP